MNTLLQPGRVSMRLILAAVAVCYGYKPHRLRTHDFRRCYSWPRQMVSYIARQTTNLSYPQIADALGYFDHTTALYGAHAVANRIETDPTQKILAAALIDVVRQMARYAWPAQALAPYAALARLIDTPTEVDAKGLPVPPPPPHHIASRLGFALTMDLDRLAAANWPPLVPQTDSPAATPDSLPPLLAYIESNP